MLVSMGTVLGLADVEKIAVGAFNVTPLEGIQVVLGVAEELGQPVILQFTPIHKSIVPLKVIGPVMVMVTERSSVSVYVYLDHGDGLGILREALEIGFTSVMHDGLVLPFEENVTNTRIAVGMAEDWGVLVEAEIGVTKRQEFSGVGEDGGGETVEGCYTGSGRARAFAGLTGIDALVCSFDTARGLYLITPKLDFDRIRRIRENIGIPIAIHSGPGVSDEDFKKCIANGAKKINHHAYLAKAGSMHIEEKCRTVEEHVSFHDVAQWTARAMKEDVLYTIRVFPHLE